MKRPFRIPPTLVLVIALLVTGGPGIALGTTTGTPERAPTTNAQPVPRPSGTAPDDTLYSLCGRVFSDPHAYWGLPTQLPERSPWAKGNALCQANDFLTYQDMIDGSTYLEQLFPKFFEFHELEKDFGATIGDGGVDDCDTSTSVEDFCSAGLPRQGVSTSRDREDLYMIRITDERVPNTNKKYFVFPLSIHGIERAGAEAGVRAAEDLATWAYCEAVAGGLAPNGKTNCTQEGNIPHPLLETQPGSSLKAGDVLKQSVIYFAFANPDGWRRGDPDNVSRFFQRYNGNGVDMNRDWPTVGYTFRPYTPWSEPETRSFGKVLQQIGPKDANGRPRWTAGIDLHGQLIDRAFSFTLLGASERDFGKNQRVLQSVKGAWSDAEARLAWSPLIIPNDQEPTTPAEMYGVQWGTVWDTIDYTVTGSFGDWIDSPIGLNGDGIDNEMSLSHIGNCGVGSCYIKDAEQLHVDGNKSLVYAMVNFSLLPEDRTFRAPGKIGYVTSNKRLVNSGTPTPPPTAGLGPQPAILDETLGPDNGFSHEFEVKGPRSTPAYYNGGLEGKATLVNVQGISNGGSTSSLVLERLRPDEEDPGTTPNDPCGAQGGPWGEINRYFNQSNIYLQAGQAVHTNLPLPGRWRICMTGTLADQLANGQVDLDITFTSEKGWEDPGQLPYDVSNMKFFTDLAKYMPSGQLVPVSASSIYNGTVSLDQFTSLVIADDAFPGFDEPRPTGPAQASPAVIQNPGVGTTPCAGETVGTCSAEFPFTVNATSNNQLVTVKLTTTNPSINDWDLYVLRKSKKSGEFVEVGKSATAGGSETVSMITPPDGEYVARLVNYSANPASAESLAIAFSNQYQGPPVTEPPATQGQLDRWGAALKRFAERGGNLVLTDGALKNLAYMKLVNRGAVNRFTVYAGFVGFTKGTADDDETYTDPLARNVNQPGAAEGANHRHQTYEPVPIGYAIQDAAGGDFNASPTWAVDQQVWEGLGGLNARVAGITTPDQVSLGELRVGNGRVRIIGPLLPMPTEKYDHPFGLANYALTYTGYQVLNNALQWQRPTPPRISVNDVTIREADSTVYATFTVSLSAVTGTPIQVRYATSGGTARAGSDYTSVSGTLSFPAGTRTRTVRVPIRGDNIREPTETFLFTLSSPTYGTFADRQGVGRIQDDDPDDPVVVLTKGAPATAAPGATITYGLSYKNLGPLTSYDARIVDRLPAGVTFVSATGGGVYSSASRTVTWRLGNVAKDAGGTRSLRVRISGSLANGTALVNTAQFFGEATLSAEAFATTVVRR